MEGPPKIRCFIWKALHHALVIMADLFERQSSPTSTCLICFVQDEIVEQLFLLCMWVKSCGLGKLNYRVNWMGNHLFWRLVAIDGWYECGTKQDRAWLWLGLLLLVGIFRRQGAMPSSTTNQSLLCILYFLLWLLLGFTERHHRAQPCN